MLKACNRVIEYSFYGLFLLVPLALWKDTSELFELNKMWFTWGLTIIIVGAWLIKMVLRRRFIFQRTPLDIPIGLFLFSQIISTIFSLDPHTSLWGYYSRFNGGLLSTISYILLYYAFLSNLSNLGGLSYLRRLLFLSLVSGLIVALWGLPSHFGYDPTCFLFRRTLDVACWTADFLPKVRIFSTLGQPDWLAAYLAILIPIAIAYFLKNSKHETRNPKSPPRRDPAEAGQSQNSNSQIIKTFLNFGHWNLFRISIFDIRIFYILITALFYLTLLYTLARSGFLGIWIALAFFFGAYTWIETKNKKSLIINPSCPSKPWRSGASFIIGLLLLITFFIGTPITQLRGFTLDGVVARIKTIQAPKTIQKSAESGGPARLARESVAGGTESGDIRRFVWEGAINAWKANPIFGTGVETFAFAYYNHKPAGQNLTSEWNFLYNKAHNEYLNFLATTGIVGLGSYLLMIGSVFFTSLKKLKTQMSKLKDETQNSKLSALSCNFELCILSFALLASYVSILVTNFFGFSVVMTNVYLFMIPAFILVLTDAIKPKVSAQSVNSSVQINASIWQWTPIFFILITGFLLLFTLFRFWQADVAYALGANLNRAGEYQQAYPNLQKAVKTRGSEPIFKDELSVNNAIIAAGLLAQKPVSPQGGDEKTQKENIPVASSLAQEAINTSNEIISKHPNNAVFWKTRTRLFYTLSQIDSRYFPRALDAIEKASLLAPNDANIWYNLGVLYGQNNNVPKGIEVLERTVKLKPDYRDTHYALGLFYHTAGQNEKAVEQMQYILKNIAPNDSLASDSIKSWEK